MKNLLGRIQITLILISMALLINFIIESIFDLFSIEYNLKYALGFCVLSLLVVSTIVKFWKPKQNVNKG
jgi:hypothetical protein